MKQRSFASLSFESKKKPTRREKFLGEMDKVVPWEALLALIAPAYPTSGRRGRPPMPAATMLRIHFMQQWYALSDPAMEDALYEIESMRRFAGLELNEEAIPDETTILKFRRFLEQHGLAVRILETVNSYLGKQGLLLRQGTIVDATIIQAPSSTKNRDKQRDPEMHQTKKGQQWYFGMKAHIGVDVESGLVHTVTTTPANVGDVTEVDKLLHGKEKTVYADAGYQGAEKRAAKRGRTWYIAAKRGSVKAMPEGELKEAVKHTEHMKAAVRSKVEHPFRVVKRQFGYQKVRFKGLFKNTAQVLTLFALSNLWMARRTLLTSVGEVRP
ncbi:MULTISPECIES: IS5 family transposase [Rhodanobacter]|uniref:IS5 family transposase n=1 Tax=Rhodanobacter humi TaxID=1888173 RepID=A0ABV4AL17_9GAMM|nr:MULTISPECIES: IS5 family transposase [Rhodanobacter]EIM03875.1 ISPsy2, transposase [Rhodanobacter denitrificans]KZC17121.1 transposase [Rhodanobacter sp. FW104-R8]KZC21536.1 transposase [Rhodanobacter denitrificans]KZC26859.1 transposase [Rhodanobacter sp. FW510-T8]KZC30622.1 transposase [Rhodanobacter sp. FW510-R10]